MNGAWKFDRDRLSLELLAVASLTIVMWIARYEPGEGPPRDKRSSS